MAFVKDFNKIQKKGVIYRSVVDHYDWNKNTEKFEKSKINWQSEIDKNKHIELKEMLKRNIKPQSETPLYYGDTTVLSNKNLVDLFNITDTGVIVQPDTKEVESKQESSDNNDSKKDSGAKLNAEKSK